MHSELYLDTARLGRMCRGARLAEQDFCWLVSRLGSSLYLERFLTHGFQSLPRRLRRRVSGLACWEGLQQFGESLGRLVQQPLELPTYFFEQSTEMLRFSAESLCSRAHRILVTDLCWPPYLSALEQVANELDRELCLATLKEMVTFDVATSNDIVSYLNEAYQAEGCDGLFLCDISYLGVRLPVERIIAELNPSFVVIDGAQAFHQRRVDLSNLSCDLYLAGTQKWFGAFHPLRAVFVGRNDNLATATESVQDHFVRQPADGLFNFYQDVKTANCAAFGTTVNVSPLICAAGALKQAQYQARFQDNPWQALRLNALSFAAWVSDSSWCTRELHESLRSGIVQLIPANRRPSQTGKRLRQTLANHGVVATAYDDGSLRFSMPRSSISLRQLSEVSRALHHTLH